MNQPLRNAMSSEHASPLALTSGIEAGGPDFHVAHVARRLAKAGRAVDVPMRH